MKKQFITTMLLIVAYTNTMAQKPEMISVKGGTFIMGNKDFADAKPHSVTVSGFKIGKFEITVGEYKKYCKDTNTKLPEQPNWGWDDQNPIVNVTYKDAVAYCNWLGEKYGGDWRLPTEAQWEFAARGGTKSNNFKYSGSDDLDEAGWYEDNSAEKTQDVGRKKPNELGIYDMSGNADEWCKDWYGPYNDTSQTNPKGAEFGESRLLRGGSWFDNSKYCHIAFRFHKDPTYTYKTKGFRVVLAN